MLRHLLRFLLLASSLHVIAIYGDPVKLYPLNVTDQNVGCEPGNNSSACESRGSQNPVISDRSRHSKLLKLGEDDGRTRNDDDDRNDYELDEVHREAARGKKNKKGYGKMLMLLAAAMKATVLYVMIHAVGLVAGKALVVAKVALAIGLALALKKSQDHGEKTSYEIIKHPHHSYVQTHSESVDYDHHNGGYDEGYRRKRRSRRR